MDATIELAGSEGLIKVDIIGHVDGSASVRIETLHGSTVLDIADMNKLHDAVVRYRDAVRCLLIPTPVEQKE